MSDSASLRPYETVGQNMRDKRLSSGISLSAMAASLQVDVETLRSYEGGLRRTPPDHLFQIARMLGVSIGCLFSSLQFNKEMADA